MTFEVTHVVRPIIFFVSLNDRAKSVITQQQDHTSTAGQEGSKDQAVFLPNTDARISSGRH